MTDHARGLVRDASGEILESNGPQKLATVGGERQDGFSHRTTGLAPRRPPQACRLAGTTLPSATW